MWGVSVVVVPGDGVSGDVFWFVHSLVVPCQLLRRAVTISMVVLPEWPLCVKEIN